ncbi:MAG: preprotein translocase subunit SecG [Allosphingosinicella sp.]
MFTFLLIIQSLVAASMVAVILMQRSEGGGLGVGGSPSGLMSARGAADFLTRATSVLATIFIVLSILLAGLATIERAPTKIDPNLSKAPPTSIPLAPQSTPRDPLAGAAAQAPANPANPANKAAGNGSVPLAQ